jgi:hypothetical protein
MRRAGMRKDGFFNLSSSMLPQACSAAIAELLKTGRLHNCAFAGRQAFTAIMQPWRWSHVVSRMMAAANANYVRASHRPAGGCGVKLCGPGLPTCVAAPAFLACQRRCARRQ